MTFKTPVQICGYAALFGFLSAAIIACTSSAKRTHFDGNIDHYTAEPPSVPPQAPESYFAWPVDQAKFVRGFSTDPIGKRRRPHMGIDLANAKNTPIFAAHEGTVIYVGREFSGYGQMILIEGRSGWATIYAHLNKSLVVEGQRVHKGQRIALMGRTGRASGVHLHFEIRKDRGPVDPLAYLPPVQLPTKQAMIRLADETAKE